MEIKRRVLIQAAQTEKNELIPIWDERLLFEKTEMYGNIITLKGEYNHLKLVECIFDLKTRKLSMGIELDYYPDESVLEFKVGQDVYVDKAYRKLTECKIVGIKYEKYQLEIVRGKAMSKWVIDKFKDLEIDGNLLYAVKHWNPIYVLSDGSAVEYSHQLFHKFSEK